MTKIFSLLVMMVLSCSCYADECDDLLLYEDAYDNPAMLSTVLPMAQVRNPQVDPSIWNEVTPYLLPENSSLKKKLDLIFGASRVTASKEAMQNAGFIFVERMGQHVYVATHPDLPKVVVKIYTDDDPTPDEWQNWVNRIKGMLLIKQGIVDLGYKKYFTVPQKWIYQLPPTPLPLANTGGCPRNFILIAEDMNIMSWEDNKLKWRHKTDKKKLFALYQMLKTYGLRDSARIGNVPWSYKGKIVFVDTEFYNAFPVNYQPLLEHISTSLRPYWKEITGLDKKN